MSVITLMSQLRNLDVKLTIEGDKLKVNAPDGVLTDELVSSLKANKSELIEFLKHASASKTAENVIPVTDRSIALPLSFAQQRLWFIHKLDESASYNMCGYFKITGPLNIEKLKQTFEIIVSRHEILRTNFKEFEGEAAQIIKEPSSFKLQVEDISYLATEQREEEIQRQISSTGNTSFNLEDGALFAAKIIKQAPEQFILLIAMHHIISDGWSVEILINELATVYGLLVRQGADLEQLNEPDFINQNLPDLDIQYGDFSVWQRQHLSGPRLQNMLNYWRAQLDGVEALELPTDYSRSAMHSARGKKHSFVLNESTVEKLKTLSQKNNATLFVTLLAAYKIVLQRYTGKTDICVGIPSANRNYPELEFLIGFFVNSLAIRSQVERESSFFEFVGQLQKTMHDADEHQELPFEKLVEELGINRELSQTPIFQTMFTLQNLDQGDSLKLSNLDLEFHPIENDTAKFDISLSFIESGNQIIGEFEYNSDLFKISTIERIAAHLNHGLQYIVDHPDCKIQDIKIFSPEEEQTILHEWNQTERAIPAKTALQLFKERAAKSPRSVAVVDDNGALSYEQLDARSDVLASYMLGQEIGAGDLVATFLPRSREMVIALLACHKVGAVYVPIDVNYPIKRVESIIQDSNPKAIIAFQSDDLELNKIDLIRINCDQIEGEQKNFKATTSKITAPESDIKIPDYDSESVAYIIYTSGSTGKPKGVSIPHRGLTNLCLWHMERYQVKAQSRSSQIASAGFDACVWEVWPYLVAGASIYIMDDDTRISAAETVRWLAEKEISHCFLVTPLAEAVLDEPLPNNWALEYLLTGGDMLTQAVPENLSFNVVNNYGPTETSVIATCGDNIGPQDGSTPPIGRPINNTKCYVLDQQLQPVPIGVEGELYIGGVGVGLGYLQRQQLSEEKFVSNPFGEGKLYRSGDLVRYREDGQIEFIGRVDFQVQIRGFRIELGEIESVINKLPDVGESIAVVYDDVEQRKYIAAYIYPGKGKSVDVLKIRQQLKHLLPDYMIPTAYQVVDKIPLTSNGKYDRQALPKISNSVCSEQKQVSPRDELEKDIAQIWRDALKKDEIGIYDDFFESGGHSLLATKVIARIKAKFKIDLPLRSIFEGATVATIAEQIRGGESVALTNQLPPIKSYSRGESLAISFAQQRLWILDQIESGNSPYSVSAAYNIASGLRLRGPLDVEALRWCFEEVVKRHEILRTTFYSKEGQIYQRILPPFSWSIVEEDLTQLGTFDQQAAIRNIGIQESIRAFDLEEGPMARRTRLLRTVLVKLAQDEHVLFVTMHHIISDGWSLKILVKEISALYGAKIQNKESPLSPLNIQYGDYARWQRDYLKDEFLDQEIRYWSQQLEGVETLELPYDYPRPPVQTFKGADVKFTIEETLVNKLSELSRQQGVTLFMTLMAAFKVLLKRYSRQQDICVGIPVANRLQKELEPLIGFFVNTLALRSDLSGQQSFTDLLAQEQKVSVDAFAHQNLPFEKMVEALKIERDLSRTPIFQVLFNFNNEDFSRTVNFPGLNAEILPTEQQTAQFDLSLHLQQNDRSIEARFDYNTDLFKVGTIKRMAEHFKNLLEAIVSQPNLAIDSLNIINEAEWRKLVVDWNNTGKRFPHFECLHHLFESQVETTPNGEALVFGDDAISYIELEKRANQLAHYLADNGVCEEDLVAVCLDRSIELVVSLYAIIKAGAAYVPLDPSYPRDRLSYILQDTQAAVILTDENLKYSFAHNQGKIICLETERSKIEACSSERVNANINGSNLAYVIYTSGSTGEPKGVTCTHRGIVNRLLWMQDEYRLNNTDRVLQKTPFSFDVSVWEFFWPLFTGATLVVAKPEGHKDPNYLNRIIRKESITTLHFVPSMLAVFLQQGDAPACQTLKRIICSGEAMSVALQNECLENLPSAALYNLYGPTEASVDVSHWTCRKIAGQASVPIGKPIANTSLYILDEKLNPVPIGVLGELHIGGVGLARGYLGKEQLTAERFIANPFVDDPSERIYKTGDLAKYLTDGNIEYHGRIDHQVKLRGLRIELGEIEDRISQFEGISDCVVLVQGENERSVLVAYVVYEEQELDLGKLKNFLKLFLPDYMIPAGFVELESIPLTPNGKANRKALLKHEYKVEQSVEFIPPRNETEEILANIWAEMLELDAVGVKDNFFDLGGHSLLATQIIARVKDHFQIELSLSALFETPTIENMAVNILTQEAQTADLDAMSQLLAELEDMDSEDLKDILGTE